MAYPKRKNYRFASCLQVVGENDAYVIYCFIECGYHTLLFIWHIFYYFFEIPILERQISGCEWGKYDNMSSVAVKSYKY